MHNNRGFSDLLKGEKEKIEPIIKKYVDAQISLEETIISLKKLVLSIEGLTF
jgi:hypothetical protein